MSNKREWNIIVLLKRPIKYREFSPTLFVKATDFQLGINFLADACSYHIWRAWYNGSYTIMAMPIRALELHYPMIQFYNNKCQNGQKNDIKQKANQTKTESGQKDQMALEAKKR